MSIIGINSQDDINNYLDSIQPKNKGLSNTFPPKTQLEKDQEKEDKCTLKCYSEKKQYPTPNNAALREREVKYAQCLKDCPSAL